MMSVRLGAAGAMSLTAVDTYAMDALAALA